MGKVVAVWSSTKKTGKTLFLYMLVNHLSRLLDRDVKVLALSYGNLMDMFKIDANELNFEDIVNYKIHPDNHFSLKNALAKQNNLYFMGSKKTSNTYASRNIKIYENLIEEFRETFDLVLFDTIAGNENPLTNMILQKSDCVLNIMNQDKDVLDRYSFITKKDAAYVINRFRRIYPDEKDIASAYGIQNIFKLPCCNNLQEMKNRGKLEFYIEHDTEYNREMSRISRFMAGMLGLKLDEGAGKEKKKRSLLGILGG